MADSDDLRARITKSLTGSDGLKLIELVQRMSSIRAESEIAGLDPYLKELFDYRYLMCGFGERREFAKRRRGPYLNVSYPAGFIEAYMTGGLIFQDAFVITALGSPGLLHSDELIDKDSWHRTAAYSVSRSFGIVEGYRSMVGNALAGMSSLVFFTAPKLPRADRTELILEILCPHVHEALRRVFNCQHAGRDNPLSAREKEVLRWIKEGKSSWAVSVILSISEATVKFHIKNIMRKLDSATRAQAVATAIEQGYIEI